MEDGKLEDGDVDENSNDDDDDEEKGSLSLFVKKSKGKKKTSGRKSAWNPENVDDLIDIVVSNTYYKRKLIFTNTKCQRNGEIYEEILTELKKKASARGKQLKFSVKQLRTKFKKCVSDCKNRQHSPYEQPQGSKDSKKTKGLATGLSLYLQKLRQEIAANQTKL